jgi:dethiobiotin synthetase
MAKFFVTGTDTNVGKTVAATVLAVGLRARYWKPVQTGTEDGRDSDFLARWIGPERVLAEAYAFPAPLSPDAAAAETGSEIELLRIRPPTVAGAFVVEGAGGVLVPLNRDQTMPDLMAHLGFPAVVVARAGLGTINHTLLTLESLRRRSLPVAGVIFMGEPRRSTVASVAHHSGAKVLGVIPICPSFSSGWFEESFRNLDFSSELNHDKNLGAQP